MPTATAPQDSPLFTIAVISDAHVRPGADETGAARRLAATLAQIRASGAELLISLGDIVHFPTDEEMAVARAALAPWPGLTVLTLPGNHEVGIAADPVERAAYARAFGADRFTYAYIFRGLMILAIDNAAADTPWTPQLDARQKWIERTLAEHPDYPVLAACHTPLVALRDPESQAASFNYYSWMNQDPEQRLLRLLERHRERIVAVLSGHAHLTAHVESGGLHHFVPSGTYSWPNHFLEIEVFPGFLSAEMRAATWDKQDFGTMTQFPLRNGIHDRHGDRVALADSKHPDAAAYVAGNTNEHSARLRIHDPAKRLLNTGQIPDGAIGAPEF